MQDRLGSLVTFTSFSDTTTVVRQEVPTVSLGGLDMLMMVHIDPSVRVKVDLDASDNRIELRQSMSRKGNCWDNAPQESFFGHMKDEIDVSGCEKYRDVRAIVDDWIDYYNNERYQWQLAKLSPNEYYGYITTGIYPLKGIIDEREKEQKFPKTN